MSYGNNTLYQPVSNAYDGKCIFITGSSGFLGKVLVEKLLYGCPNIAKIYVLLRNTKKENAKDRLKKMFGSPPFQRLKEKRPQDLDKIVPIAGDIATPNLGITPEDENILIKNVSMVFHVAATVKFNEDLQVILNINYEGTRRVLELCSKLKNLEVMVYVSTAYSNGNREVIEEVVYPPTIPLRQVEELIKLPKTYTREQIKGFLKGLPNTYTMSKGFAENLVAEFQRKHKCPVVIIRPSILSSSKYEPVKGWVGNWHGATYVMVAVGNGIIRIMNCDGNNIVDLIPVDYVANLMIVAGAKSRSVEDVKVYNSCSSATNPITVRKVLDHAANDTGNLNKASVYSKVFFIKWRWLMIIVRFLLETIPAYLADWVSIIRGKKPIYMKYLSKSRVVRKSHHPITSRTWMIKSENTTALYNSLSPSDSRLFPYDARDINWDKYIPVYLQGIQTYLLDSQRQ